MNFFTRLNETLNRFMTGRYGNDNFNRALLILWLLVTVLNLFLRSTLFYVLGLVLCVIVFFRMLSKNAVKRQRENYRYYQFITAFQKKFRYIAVRFRDRKTTRFFHCPKCKAPIRMPKKVGKFNLRCRACGHQFQKEFKK